MFHSRFHLERRGRLFGLAVGSLGVRLLLAVGRGRLFLACVFGLVGRILGCFDVLWFVFIF